MKKFPTLYSRASSGKVQQWTIISDGDAFYTEAGQVDGKITVSKPNKCIGKNIGKANETTPEQQAVLEAQAKWEKKVKEDYKEDIKDIDNLTFLEPMTAKKFKEYDEKGKVTYPIADEDKLNGGRGVLWNAKDGLWLYSRNGEKWNCIDHILFVVKNLYKKYPNLVLDGELYNPALKNDLGKLMSLVSVMRKPEEITLQEHAEAEGIVQYHVYDAYGYENISKDTPFEERKASLEKLVKGTKYVFYHPYRVLKSREEVMKAKAESAARGEEGRMLKVLGSPYENKRSKYFLKLKNFDDDEFEVEGFTEGSGDWAGCVKTTICKLHKPHKTTGETTFDTNMRGSMEELRALWEKYKSNPSFCKGKKITVTYQGISPDGVPLIPYADALFRDYE
jgi:DNA ligase 1